MGETNGRAIIEIWPARRRNVYFSILLLSLSRAIFQQRKLSNKLGNARNRKSKHHGGKLLSSINYGIKKHNES